MFNNFDSEVIDDKNAPDIKSMPLEMLVQHLLEYDTNAPYQRGRVWTKKYRVELIRSILKNIPINTFHFVCKDKRSNTQWVLDGKQRIETIRAFCNNEFRVPVKVLGEPFYLNYSNLLDNKHKCSYLRNTFNHFQINSVHWKYMSYDEQRDVFIIINNSTDLNNNEKIYCEHYNLQKLLIFLFDEYFGSIKSVFSKQISENKRFTGIRLAHQLLILISGYGLMDEPYCARDLTPKKIRESAQQYEGKLLELGFNEILPDDKDAMKKFVFENKIFKTKFDILKSAIMVFERAISFKSEAVRKAKLDANFVLDVLGFFGGKIANKEMTKACANERMEMVNEFIWKWYDYKNKNKDTLKKTSTQKSWIEARIKAMEKIWGEVVGNYTCNPTTQAQKNLALLKTDSNCPITGACITADNVQLDHVIPTSVGGPTTLVAVSDVGNLKKSNLTLDNLSGLKKYVNANN